MSDALGPTRESAPAPPARPRAATQQRALDALGRPADAQDPSTRRRAASQLVSELFFKPLLAEMRKFPFGRELATGGQTESIFGERLDERLADTISGTARGLLDRLMRDLDARGGRAALMAPAAEAASQRSGQDLKA